MNLLVVEVVSVVVMVVVLPVVVTQLVPLSTVFDGHEVLHSVLYVKYPVPQVLTQTLLVEFICVKSPSAQVWQLLASKQVVHPVPQL